MRARFVSRLVRINQIFFIFIDVFWTVQILIVTCDYVVTGLDVVQYANTATADGDRVSNDEEEYDDLVLVLVMEDIKITGV